MLSSADMLVFSHLRWSWVYQRPQHLMTRAALHRRVFFFEEAILDAREPFLEVTAEAPGLTVVIPHLAPGTTGQGECDAMRKLLADMIEDFSLRVGTLWFFTPSAVAFAVDIPAPTVVYDCMDELTAFAGAPASLMHNERQLLAKADVVFTGGWSLYDAKRSLHPNVHAMPSGVDLEHFRRARRATHEDPAQVHVARPRIGYAGVLDERLDIELIHSVVESHPHYQFVFAGPVTKIDPSVLPTSPNAHYLGQIPYDRLPDVLGGWDAAWIPFARNDATRFISPTKTPEYLAAGLPVLTTPIHDVVRSWGDEQSVNVVTTAADFTPAIERAFSSRLSTTEQRDMDRALASHSWDALWHRMSHLMSQANSNAA